MSKDNDECLIDSADRYDNNLSLVVRFPTCVILSFRINILFARTLTRLRINFWWCSHAVGQVTRSLWILNKIISQSSFATTLIFKTAPGLAAYGSPKNHRRDICQNIPMSPEIFLHNKDTAWHHKSHYLGRISCSENIRISFFKLLLHLHNAI